MSKGKGPSNNRVGDKRGKGSNGSTRVLASALAAGCQLEHQHAKWMIGRISLLDHRHMQGGCWLGCDRKQ